MTTGRGWIAAILGAVALLAAAAVRADSYFIEVGGDMAREDAAKDWETLSGKHKFLHGLKFYPKTIIQGGREVAVRMQGGSLDSKEKAQKICKRLFAAGTQCFVIEGVGDTPPAELISLSERAAMPMASVGLPWLSPPPGAPASTEVEKVNPRPAPEPAAEPLAEAHSNARGKVDVAEAIRVPLSEGTEENAMPITVHDLAEEKKPVPQAAAVAIPAATVEKPGWLWVYAFTDENAAITFWERIRATVPQQAAGLRVRITRPLAAGRHAGTSLTMGPFAGREDAESFCNEGVIPLDKNVHCRFGTEEPVNETSPIVPPHVRSDAYAARRQAVRMEPPAAMPSEGGRLYWVQVVTAADETEALREWEEVRTRNSDLLEGLRSSTAMSMTGARPYVVRIGPIISGSDAGKLCSTLQSRGVMCKVMLYSGT